MLIVADTHVHLYSCYDLNRAFHRAFENLEALCRSAGQSESEAPRDGAGSVLALFLSERAGCRFLADMAEGKIKVDDADLRLERSPEPAALILEKRGAGRLYIFAGRQIATRERMEILALGQDVGIQDGGDLLRTAQEVSASGAVPILPWSPGKWLFGRGKVVRAAIERLSPDKLLIGDTCSRPAGWPEPRLMRYARARDFRVVAGSDPLPFPGEEDMIGQYGIAADAEFDTDRPVTSMLRILTGPETELRLLGRRCGLLTAARRMVKGLAGKRGHWETP